MLLLVEMKDLSEVSGTDDGRTRGFMATIKDVAREAGVSATTVSIIINGKAKERAISEATQKKVYETMRKMGYSPSASARRLRSSEPDLSVIAFFWPLDFRTSILSDFLNSMQKELEKIHFDCGLMIQTYKANELEKVDNVLLKGGYNGIIVGGCSEKDLMHLESLNIHTPLILINRESRMYTTVGTDNDAIGLLAAEAFARRNCRELAVFSSSSTFVATGKRKEAFLASCSRMGIAAPEKFRFSCQSSIEGGVEIGERFCSLTQKPHFVFCDSDAIALGALYAFYRHKVRVPEDVEILTIGLMNPMLTRYSVPSLSTLRMPNKQIAGAAIDLMQKMILGEETSVRHILKETEVTYRESFPAERK